MRKKKEIHIKNRRAFFDYELIDRLVAGMQLTGTEIKSVRSGKASIGEGYCYFRNDELWVKGIHIAEYPMASYNNHDPLRERKLLLKKRELRKLQKKNKEKGFTIIPLYLFINERGWAKLEIALARGKRQYDKRHSIREREEKVNLNRLNKLY